MDYNKAKVYKLTNDIDNDIYVGSTTQPLHMRLKQHYRDRSQHPHIKLYKKMNELGKDHFQIELLEDYPCNTRRELTAREEHYRITLGAALNTVVCNSGCETRKEYRKKLYHNNREEAIESVKEWRESNPEYAYLTRRAHYEKNKEEILKKHAVYRNNHKEKIAEWKSTVITCSCGRETTLGHKSRHEKTECHRRAMLNKQQVTQLS